MTQVIAPSDTIHNRKTGGPVAALMATLLCILGLFGLSGSAEAKTYAYVFNIGSGDVSVIDTEVQEVIETVDTGLRIRWFASRFFDGKRVWSTDADLKKAEVVVIDTRTYEVVRRIPVGEFPCDITLSLDGRLAATST